MITALFLGAGFGLGVLALVVGLFPSRPQLAETLAQLRRVPTASPSVSPGDTGGLSTRFGRPMARALMRTGGDRLAWPSVRRDLTVLGRSVEHHMAEKAALAIVGLLLVPVGAVLLALGGSHLPVVIPAWGALLCATGGFLAPDLWVRAEARTKRRDFRHALSAYLDLVTIALAGGGGVETALSDAASIGDGWAFAALRQALDAARLARETPWAALGRLGHQLGIDELSELAASVALAGTEGAKVRASLAAKAVSLRTHELAEAEAAAQAATERMSLPVVLLFSGFLLFIGFPAIERVLHGL